MEIKNFERGVVEVARKVLVCALEQLQQAQALVDQAQKKYWSAVEKYRSASNSTYSECESAKAMNVDCCVGDVQQSDFTPDSQQQSRLSQVKMSGTIRGERSDSSMEPTSFVLYADVTPPTMHAESRRRSSGTCIEFPHVLAAEHAESDRLQERGNPPSQPGDAPVSVSALLEDETAEWNNAVSPRSPRAHTPTDAGAEGDESRESASPSCLPSLRAHALSAEPGERDEPPKCDREASVPCPPSPPKRSTHVNANIKIKDCLIKLKRLENEKRKTISKQYGKSTPNKLSYIISITPETLLMCLRTIWRYTSTRGLTFPSQTTESTEVPLPKHNNKIERRQERKDKSAKKKNKTKESEEDKLARRREKDRLRKREQRKKIKEKQKQLKLSIERVSNTRHQHSTLPKPMLLTDCTECLGNCWFTGLDNDSPGWILCVGCKKNWANAACAGRIPYECRPCRRDRLTPIN